LLFGLLPFGFAALLAESLWLSVRRLLIGALAQRRSREIIKNVHGKAEPLRKECGKAERQEHKTQSTKKKLKIEILNLQFYGIPPSS
jgi:hypothetical protein